MPETLVPGALVRHPEVPEWGTGQVQTVVGTKITVSFEHRGKVVIDGAVVTLIPVEADPDDDAW